MPQKSYWVTRFVNQSLPPAAKSDDNIGGMSCQEQPDVKVSYRLHALY